MDAGVVVNTDANTEESVIRVDVSEQIVIMKVFIKVRVWALQIEDEAFKIGVAVGHQFYCFLFGLEANAFLDCHA